MTTIRLIDRNFAHATCCSNGNLKVFPKHFRWYRGDENREITVFVDNEYYKVSHVSNSIKVWMLLEPPSISAGMYTAARRPEVQAMFDYILTFDKSLTGPKFVYYPMGGCWIEEFKQQIYPKTKNISIIASEKNHTIGHRLRHEVIQCHQREIDVYGRGYNFVADKLDALRDYRFTIVIENCQLDNYFSEKLIDPMVVGTIPIYWGAPTIHEYFKGDFYSLQFLPTLLKEPDRMATLYERNVEEGMVQRNYDRARQFTITENWLWDNFFTKICTTTPKM